MDSLWAGLVLARSILFGRPLPDPAFGLSFFNLPLTDAGTAGAVGPGLVTLGSCRDANGSAVAGRMMSGRRGARAGRMGAEASPVDAVDDECVCFTGGEKVACADSGRFGRPRAAAASRLRAAIVSFSVVRGRDAAVALREKRDLALAEGSRAWESDVAPELGLDGCRSSSRLEFASKEDMML